METAVYNVIRYVPHVASIAPIVTPANIMIMDTYKLDRTVYAPHNISILRSTRNVSNAIPYAPPVKAIRIHLAMNA